MGWRSEGEGGKGRPWFFVVTHPPARHLFSARVGRSACVCVCSRSHTHPHTHTPSAPVRAQATCLVGMIVHPIPQMRTQSPEFVTPQPTQLVAGLALTRADLGPGTRLTKLCPENCPEPGPLLLPRLHSQSVVISQVSLRSIHRHWRSPVSSAGNQGRSAQAARSLSSRPRPRKPHLIRLLPHHVQQLLDYPLAQPTGAALLLPCGWQVTLSGKEGPGGVSHTLPGQQVYL